MIGEACVYLGKVFVPHWEKTSVFVNVYECHESLEQTTQILQLCVKPREDSAIKKCNMRAVGNTLSGRVSLYVIVLFENNRINIFSCSEWQDSCGLLEVESFTSANLFCSSVNDVYLADGPLVTVANGSKLYLHSGNSGKKYDVQKVLRTPVSLCEILNIVLVCHQSNPEGTITVYLLVVSLSSVNPSRERVQFLFYFQSCAVSTKEADLCQIKTSFFLPVTLASSVTAIDVLVKHPGLLQVPPSHSFKDVVSKLPWIENRTVLCTKKQCLVFSRSFLQYSCSIPYLDVRWIFPLLAYSCESQNINIILQSSSTGVCCLKIEEKMHSMKCIKEWKDVAMAVVGCILGNGAKQLLLLHSLDPDDWHQESSFADINLTVPCKGGGEDSSETASSSNHLRNAVIGLQKRVMAGKASVTELQYRISEKQVVTSEILTRLHGHGDAAGSVISEENSSFFQESLVDILPLNDSVSLKNGNEKALNAAVRICGQWKTVFRGNCIFGWTLENLSNSFIMNPKVHAVLENALEKSIQKLFIHQSEGLPCQPRLSDPAFEQVIFKSGDMLSLVLCFAVPAFLSDTVSASFVISWCERKTQESHEFYFASTSEENTYQQIITKSTVTVADVLEKSPFRGLSVVQQLMSFRVLQQRTVISISSMNSDLSAFEELLQSGDQPNAPVLVNHLGMKIVIFDYLQSAFCGINVSWKQLEKTSVEITVYSRHARETILFTQWMYNILPSDVLILPRSMKTKEALEMRNRILVSMKNEVDLMLEFMSSGRCVTTAAAPEMSDRAGGSQTNENQSGNRIIFPKNKFQEIRELLLKNELLTDNIIKKIV